MINYVYLALVDKNFIFDDSVKLYFKERNIKVLKFYSKFNMLKLESQKTLFLGDIKYISYLELEKEFSAISQSLKTPQPIDIDSSIKN